MSSLCSRRTFAKAAAVLPFAGALRGATGPTAPVAIARCTTYGKEVETTLAKMFDQIGGLERIVKGKTVAVKINLTGNPDQRLGHLPSELTHWTHPAVIGATCYLMGRAGAARIRLLESPWRTAEPIEEGMIAAGWDPQQFLSAAPKVEFENTNYLGNGKRYVRLYTPKGGHMFKAFDLNHSYEDCDVFVSIAKLKEHRAAGVTMSMKNCFGITPCTIYGDGAPDDEPGLVPQGGRGPLHSGYRQPSKSALPQNDLNAPKEAGYRVPRIVADLVAARPIHLAIIDGIQSQTSSETPWYRETTPVAPGVLVAGTNCVGVDAVGMALMGFDPMADRGSAPFERCDNTLRLAEELGVGTRDLKRIEVAGGRIEDLRFDYRAATREAMSKRSMR